MVLCSRVLFIGKLLTAYRNFKNNFFYSLLNLHCKRRINCLYRARNFWPPYCGRTIYNHDLLRTQTLHSNVSFLLVGRYDKKHFECFYAWIPFAKIIKADCFLVYFKSTLTISFHYFPLNIYPRKTSQKLGLISERLPFCTKGRLNVTLIQMLFKVYLSRDL